MNAFLTRSHRLKRIHMLVTVIIVGILSYTMLTYFSELKAKVEKITFMNTLNLIDHMLNIKNVLSSEHDPHCEFLKHPTLFKQTIGIGNVHLHTLHQVPSAIFLWEYEPMSQSLTYFVQSKDYFQGSYPDKIVISFICSEGLVRLKVSSYQWCQTMGLLGCRVWG